MKKRQFTLLLLLSLMCITNTYAQKNINELKNKIEYNFNFIIATDLGRNGGYQQKPIADLMGKTAEDIDMEFVIASGDTHHYLGIESVQDPLWMTNFELIYSHPELQLEWYPILGNHEYKGNTQAVIDYSKISRRWKMPARYYTQAYTLKNGESLRIIYIDTPPLIDKYRTESQTYPDAVKQDMAAQLTWIENTLKNSTEKWKIVVGHHPIYADTSKDGEERRDMQSRIDPILRKYNVDMYICGHIHNFQHIRIKDSNIEYIVNSSGSLSRKVSPVDGTQFCSSEAGFSVFSVTPEGLKLYMINPKGDILHIVEHRK